MARGKRVPKKHCGEEIRNEEDLHEDSVRNMHEDPRCATAASPIDVVRPAACNLHMKGQVDVVDLPSRLGIEFKTPEKRTTYVPKEQLGMHTRLRKIDYEVHVCNDDMLFRKILTRRRRQVRTRCSCCSRSALYTAEELVRHEKKRRLKLGRAALRLRPLPKFVKAKGMKKSRAASWWPAHNQVVIRNSDDLQEHLVLFIGIHYKHVIYIANISRFAKDRSKAIARGCEEGQPEILILNPSKEHSGLAVSLKPRLSEKETAYLRKLLAADWKVVRSNDRNTLMRELCEYAERCRRA